MTMTIILLSISLFTSMMMIISLNPITMGVLILMMALSLAMIYGLTLSSWIAFLLFLIYVSGMLVMFAYFVALSPNQQMNKFIMIPSIIFILSVVMTMSWANIYPNMTPTFQYLMNTFYTNMNIPMLIMLAMILFLTMVVVVKIVTNTKGPLRPFMKYV